MLNTLIAGERHEKNPPTRITIQITISKIIKTSSRIFYSFIFKCIRLEVCFLNKDDLFLVFSRDSRQFNAIILIRQV